MNRKLKFLALIVFFAMLLTSTSGVIVNAQGDATVTVSAQTGGNTDVTGTNTYPDGTAFNITATPLDNYAFIGWVVTTDTSSTNYLDNPLSITLAGGTTYTITPQFSLLLAPPGQNLPNQLTNAAIVVVLASAGGTTSPAPGTYGLADATNMQLKATAFTGWQFSNWIISGTPSTHGGYPVDYTPTDNPYTVGHGYGYTYYYQPVFTPVGNPQTSSSPTATASPTTTMAGLSIDIWIIIALAIVIVVMAIGFLAYAMRRKK
jgi:hypothetical protein